MKEKVAELQKLLVEQSRSVLQHTLEQRVERLEEENMLVVRELILIATTLAFIEEKIGPFPEF